MKAVRATKTSQQRVEQLAEKEGKANERAAKVAEKATWNVTNTASRGHRCARGVMDKGKDEGEVGESQSAHAISNRVVKSVGQ